MKTVNNGQRTTDNFRYRAGILAWQIVMAIGMMLVGATLSMAFFFTEQEFWSNVARFWR